MIHCGTNEVLFLRIIGECMYDLLKVIDGSDTILSNVDRTQTSFFEHWTNSKVFIYWWSNSNTRILASNKRTSNPKSLLNYSSNRLKHHFFPALNGPKRVRLLLIELKQPIIGFERSNIELRTTNIVRPLTK